MSSASGQSIAEIGIALMIVCAPVSCFGQAIPPWVRDATKLTSHSYQTACEGIAPSVDIARAAAIQECKASVAHALSKSFSTSSITITTEATAGLHEEVSSSERFDNLFCKPKREEIKETPGSFEVWVLCSFGLDGMRVSEAQLRHPENAVQAVPDLRASNNNYIHSDQHTVSLACIPSCDSVMVLGNEPRIVKCNGNPTSVVVSSKDRQLILRATDHISKRIDLTKGNADESYQIVFDPM